MYCAAAVVGRQHSRRLSVGSSLVVVAIVRSFFLQVAFAVLKAVLTNILSSLATTRDWSLLWQCLTLSVAPSAPSLLCAERSEYLNPSVSWMASMMDLLCISEHSADMWAQVPRYCSLHLEPFFAVNVTTQGVFDSNALKVIGWLDERVKARLLSHGDGDGWGSRKNELGHHVCRYEAGCVLVQLIAQSSLQ